MQEAVDLAGKQREMTLGISKSNSEGVEMLRRELLSFPDYLLCDDRPRKKKSRPDVSKIVPVL